MHCVCLNTGPSPLQSWLGDIKEFVSIYPTQSRCYTERKWMKIHSFLGFYWFYLRVKCVRGGKVWFPRMKNVVAAWVMCGSVSCCVLGFSDFSFRSDFLLVLFFNSFWGFSWEILIFRRRASRLHHVSQISAVLAWNAEKNAKENGAAREVSRSFFWSGEVSQIYRKSGKCRLGLR